MPHMVPNFFNSNSRKKPNLIGSYWMVNIGCFKALNHHAQGMLMSFRWLAAPDPLLNTTGLGGKTASTFDVNHFFDHGTKLPSMCKFCCNPAEFDKRHLTRAIQYSKSTAMTTLCLHIKRFHLYDYLDLALQEGRDWPIQLKVMKECIIKGYSLQELKSLVKKGIDLKSLPPHPISSTSNPGSGAAGADDRGSTPPFSFAMFHKLLIDFIIADDQLLLIIECEKFWHLLLLLKNDLKDNDIPHHTKIKSNIIQGWKNHFTVLKTDLQLRQATSPWTMNAKNNIAMMDHLVELLNEQEPPLKFVAKDRHIMCFTHIIINLCIQDVISGFTAANVADDFAQAWHDDVEDKQEYIDAMRGDPLNCVHSTIHAIHASGVRCNEFSSLITDGNKGQWFKSPDREMIVVPDLQLLHDIKT
ncbi:hypothetical protein EDD17DRAFT_1512489 [Pisolithus thermaeus]|nr:hypothetical protein EV401DRAFT_1894089 [Pisolithus croceorrhizus]KAI6156430.1 hypothetical protein EDD17DRAFT_1512489 [Pisolithus thermaeus]